MLQQHHPHIPLESVIMKAALLKSDSADSPSACPAVTWGKTFIFLWFLWCGRCWRTMVQFLPTAQRERCNRLLWANKRTPKSPTQTAFTGVWNIKHANIKNEQINTSDALCQVVTVSDSVFWIRIYSWEMSQHDDTHLFSTWVQLFESYRSTANRLRLVN